MNMDAPVKKLYEKFNEIEIEPDSQLDIELQEEAAAEQQRHSRTEQTKEVTPAKKKRRMIPMPRPPWGAGSHIRKSH